MPCPSLGALRLEGEVVVGLKVALASVGVIAGIAVLPRLALLSAVGLERALVSTLLSFEQAVAGFAWSMAKWVCPARYANASL